MLPISQDFTAQTSSWTLQIDLTPRASVQLLYTVKRANLTRLPIWRSSRSESRQIDRIGSEASIFNLELQPNHDAHKLSDAPF